ncbi:MAG: DUF1851 domain-containing protein [Oscillospiraceae bacterium]|nr:DUF1851 domain-containing protein [Oscillospiraceae bacterium]
MYDPFKEFFNTSLSNLTIREKQGNALLELRNEFQGMEFGDGIYRVFRTDDIPKWKKIISGAYNDFRRYFEPFGFDWLGRCFAVDLRKKTKSNILMFEIGTAEVLEIPCNIIEFHNKEIPLNGEACLSKSFFAQWRASNRQNINYSECIGYKVPLFLNGEDSVQNLELSDMEVYWSVISQIKNQIM